MNFVGKRISQYPLLFVLFFFFSSKVQIKYSVCYIADMVLQCWPCIYNAVMRTVAFLSSILAVYHPLTRCGFYFKTTLCFCNCSQYKYVSL